MVGLTILVVNANSSTFPTKSHSRNQFQRLACPLGRFGFRLSISQGAEIRRRTLNLPSRDLQPAAQNSLVAQCADIFLSILRCLRSGRFRPIIIVTGNEFLRRVRRLGKETGITVSLNASRGKGSHQTLYYGTAFSIVRNLKDELKAGTLHGMCGQLGIKASDLY
jgi:mRNA interferase HicA